MLLRTFDFIPFADSNATFKLDCKIEDEKNSHGIEVRKSLNPWWISKLLSGRVSTIRSKVGIKDSYRWQF
jgi:hypothetical protein